MDTETEKEMPVIKAEPVGTVKPEQPICKSGPAAVKPVPGEPEFPEIRKSGLNLHPMSGLLILFLDYAFFVEELTIIGLPFTCIFAFMLSFTGIFLIQKYIDEEKTGRAVAKAFFGGVVTGLPTPVFGTVFGTMILVISGLSFLKRR